MKKRLLLFLFCVSLIFGLTSCKGPAGEKGGKGDPGNPGDPGGKITEYTGSIPGDGSIGVVSIGSGPLPTDTTVTVYYAFPELPDMWTELGAPTGEGSVELYPYCVVDY